MGKFDKETMEIVKRLQNARLSLLQKQPFYAILLMHMKFSLDESCESAYTDGERIAFNRDYIQSLSDRELEFMLMHQVLHVALGHPFRRQADYDQQAYDIACDIIVNSNILYSFGMDKSVITTKQYGEAIHLTPDGNEGYEYTLEQVYEMVCKALQRQPQKGEDDGKQGQGESDSEGEGKGEGQGEGKGEGKDEGKGKGKGKGKAGKAGGAKAAESCDVVDPLIASEEDLQALIASLLRPREQTAAPAEKSEEPADVHNAREKSVDDHSFWEGDDQIGAQSDVWSQNVLNADQLISSLGGNGRGTVPLAVKRIMEELKNPTIDWRSVLQEFIQEDICDYSFSPPDKRMEDSPFFLPDFNEKDEQVKDILFMIDTSGSMSNKQISQCYSEIYGGIQQFNGKLQGKLGFFDAVVVEPVEFTDEDEFKIIRPKGGGGTSFHIIFEYVQKHMDVLPVSIVILTDGYAPFPEKKAAMDIPVLWVINNEKVTPPWGKIARIPNKV